MGKMLKYEFKATWKFMCIMFLCICVISVGIFTAVELNQDDVIALTDDMGNVLDYVSETWVYGIACSAFLMAAAVVLMICFGIVRFKKALTHEEGYLVHTLPVGAESIILSKAITFFAYAIPIVSVTFIGFFGLFFNGEGGLTAARLGGELAVVTNGFNLTSEQIIIAIGSLVSGVMSLFQLYAVIVIGYSFDRHKKMWTLVAFIAMMVASSFVVELLQPIRNRISYMQSEDIIIILFEIAVAVLFFFITYYFMKKRPCVE